MNRNQAVRSLSFGVRYIKNLWLYKLCKHLKVIFYLWIQTAALTEEQTAWIPNRNISGHISVRSDSSLIIRFWRERQFLHSQSGEKRSLLF